MKKVFFHFANLIFGTTYLYNIKLIREILEFFCLQTISLIDSRIHSLLQRCDTSGNDTNKYTIVDESYCDHRNN